LDGEAIPWSELIKIGIGDGHLHGILLREVRRLEFVLLFRGALLVLHVLLVVVEEGEELPAEKVDVA
jgi:hypothetical protein